VNGDSIDDFAIGVPHSSLGGTDSGAVYVVFGDDTLDDQAPGTIGLDTIAATSRGVVLVGDAAGDLAGTAVSWAGDLDGDGDDDLLVGAPGATPGSLAGAGKVYLLHGPLAAGTIDLGTVGTTTPGIVFHGESAGDALGTSVSWWKDPLGSDDLLLGAPGADVLDEFGDPVVDAGQLYAIHGGFANLDDKAAAGVIELGQVASGAANQVTGVVFLGAVPDGAIGRTTTGAVDVDDDGVADVLVGGENQAWLVPGKGPKTVSGSSTVQQKDDRPTVGGSLARSMGGGSVVEDFGATALVPGDDGDVGDLTVGPAGDVNGDGIDDLVVGAAGADPGGRTDAGKAYVVYGRPAPLGDEVLLSEVGVTVAGITVEGAEPGDGLGAAASGAADVTGDGVADLLLGAPLADEGATLPTDTGQAYVISPVSPDEVVQVLLEDTAGVTTLEWTVPHRALSYNVYRGLLSTVRATGFVRTSEMTTLACAIVTDADLDDRPDATDATPAPVSDVLFYLVTAENLTGEGPLGPPGAVPARVLDEHCP
jgi:hypothetical protein